MHYDCLIVDDETAIASSTSEYFNLFELSSAYVTSYEQCIDFLKENTVSLLLLDINLGDRSGFGLCKKLREQTDIPILFISARTSDDDILTALNIGGDDYITKPFDTRELLARIEVQLRPAAGRRSPDLTCGPLTLSPLLQQVSAGGQTVKLTRTETAILKLLMRNSGQVITKSEMLEQISEDTPDGMESSAGADRDDSCIVTR